MSSLHKNGRYWIVRWRDKAGKQRGKSLGRINKLGKRKALAEMRKMRLDDSTNERSRLNLSELASRYIDIKPELTRGSAYLYCLAGRYLTTFFGSRVPCHQVTPAAANDFRAALADGKLSIDGDKKLSGSTVWRIIKEIKTMFQSAVDEGLLEDNPFAKVRNPLPVPDGDWAYITISGLEQLMESCPSDAWQMLLALMRLAGLRKGEALALTWNDIDLDGKRLHVRPTERNNKKRPRCVPICPRLGDILFKVYMKSDADESPLAELRYRNLWRDFRVIAKRANVEPYARWAHTLRKNCQTDWCGVMPIHVVAEWLGNSPVVAMKHYLKATEKDYELITKGKKEGVNCYGSCSKKI